MTLEDVKQCDDVTLLGETFYMQLFLDWNVLHRTRYKICGETLWNINNVHLDYIHADNIRTIKGIVLYCGLSEDCKARYRDVIDIDVFNADTVKDDGTLIYDGEKYLIDDVKYVSSNPEYMKRAYPNVNKDVLLPYLKELAMAPAGRRVDENGQICLWDYYGEYIHQKDGRRVTTHFQSNVARTVHVFGDSRVSGFMLEDKDLFTNILQEKFISERIQLNVANYGIPGREIDRMEYQIKKASIKKNDYVFCCTGCYEYREAALERQRQFIEHIKRAKEYCDKVGARFIYINMPTTVEIRNKTVDEIFITSIYRNYKFREYTYDLVNQYKIFLFLNLQKNGICCHDMAIDFEQKRDELLFINMHHYSPAGNDVLAKYFFDAICAFEIGSESRVAHSLYKIAKKSNLDYARHELKKYLPVRRTRIKLGGWQCLSTNEGRFRLKIQLLAICKELVRGKGANGAIVMNANPFTMGHRYLVEYASSNVNHLYVIVLEEDKSEISFLDRLKMVYLGCKDIKNVTVIPGGNNVISNETFPEYFIKEELQDKEINAFKDIERFALYVAPEKGIKIRYVGEEPFDNVTKQYNEQMQRFLPRWGIELVEIPRKENDGMTISASSVRRAIHNNDWDTVLKMVPMTTYKYLKNKFSGL